MNKTLFKSTTDKKLAGVCGGLAKYLNMDAGLIRIITVVIAVCGGLSIPVYIIAALVLPTEEEVMARSGGTTVVQ